MFSEERVNFPIISLMSLAVIQPTVSTQGDAFSLSTRNWLF